MSDIYQGDDNDLSLENGDLVMTEGATAVKQSVSQRLKMFGNEWFLDLAAGVPYYQDVLLKDPNPAIVEGLLKNEIISTPGIIELLSFDAEYDPQTRGITIRFDAMSYDGVINFFEILGGNNQTEAG